MSGLLSGQVCLVTGSLSGIGESTVKRFLSEGATVFSCDITAESSGDEDALHTRHMDVTDPDQWLSVIDEVMETEGGIDVLVNNAGLVGSYEAITDLELQDWERIIKVNQTSVFLGMRAVIPHMKKAHSGSIVNVSSLWGLVGTSGVAAYQASKGAVTLMTMNAAITYARDGIRVNSVHPGLIMTPMTRAQDKEITKGPYCHNSDGEGWRGARVAAAITFLASSESSYITGVHSY